MYKVVSKSVFINKIWIKNGPSFDNHTKTSCLFSYLIAPQMFFLIISLMISVRCFIDIIEGTKC